MRRKFLLPDYASGFISIEGERFTVAGRFICALSLVFRHMLFARKNSRLEFFQRRSGTLENDLSATTSNGNLVLVKPNFKNS